MPKNTSFVNYKAKHNATLTVRRTDKLRGLLAFFETINILDKDFDINCMMWKQNYVWFYHVKQHPFTSLTHTEPTLISHQMLNASTIQPTEHQKWLQIVIY